MFTRRALFGVFVAIIAALRIRRTGAVVPTLTVTGNEITDATRALGIEGDGRIGDSSFGLHPATRNFHPNGGFETDLFTWAAYGDGAAIARVADTPTFGGWCCEVTNGIESADFATLLLLRHGAVSPWVRAEDGATITVTFLLDDEIVSQDSTVLVGAGWQRIVTRHTAPEANALATLRIERDGGGTFWLDGVMVQQNENYEVGTTITGSVVTPYVHTDVGAEVWTGQPNLHPNGDFEDDSDGWEAFGSGASLNRTSDWARTGTDSLEVTTDTTANIGCRSVNFASLTPDTLYAVSVWVDAPANESFKVEVTDGDGRAAIDFTWTPGAGGRRKILTFTARSGSCSLYISKNSSNAITFRVDAVTLQAQPESGDEPYIPDGVSGYSDVTAPSAGVIRPSQMWFVIRTRLAFGTDDHPAGSVRFFRCADDDAHRVEAFYAISTDSWGVRRAFPDDHFFSCQINASAIPAVAGQTYTVIGQYTPEYIAISVNGSGFDDYAQSKELSDVVVDITNATFEIAPTGAAESSQSGGQDVLWFAIGHGILDDAGAATIHGFGDDDPALSDFPHGSRPRFLWTADDATAGRLAAVVTPLGDNAVQRTDQQRFG